MMIMIIVMMMTVENDDDSDRDHYQGCVEGILPSKDRIYIYIYIM